MDNNDIKIQIEELTKKVAYHADRYYNQDSPEISDYDYDKLFHKLLELEEAHPEYKLSTSPTVRIGGSAQNTFAPVEHIVQMGSLQDVFSIEELRDFDKRVRDTVPSPEYVVEHKIDGLSVSLQYENGVFTVGSTRGNGFVGEDVTANLRTIRSIPLTLPTQLPQLEVRGEVYMSQNSFEQLISKQELAGEQLAKNPRNAAAGSLRQKNAKITAQRKLDIFCFNIQQIDGADIDNHTQSLDYLKELGFVVSPSYCVFDNIEDVIAEIEKIGNNRGEYSYSIDGAVVKVNNFEQRTTLGGTGKYPKWAVAYKYPPEEKNSVLLDVEINVGRTGAITPTAVFEPINLAGTTVSRAVLHNQDFIDEKQIAIGDTIVVRKAGDIIPEVVKVLEHCGNEVYKLPQSCPSCGAEVVKDSEQAVVRCVNMDCPAQLVRGVIHFCSRNAMNIDGMGDAICAMLIDEKLITSVADLYTLSADDLIGREGFAKRKAEKLITAIDGSKTNKLGQLLFGLGIPNIGEKAAKLLADKFGDIDSIISASAEEIAEIDGFGGVMAQSVASYFSDDKKRVLIEKLKSAGVNTATEKTATGDKLAGLTFVITGTLPSMGRKEAAELIEQNGGKTSSSVSKNTSYLLAGEEAGSKLTKANSLGITVITEQELLEILGN